MTDDDVRRMTEAYLSYKLIIWAFGSGELKIRVGRKLFFLLFFLSKCIDLLWSVQNKKKLQ